MKILLIIPSTLRGGVEEYSLRITSAAAQKGWDVHAAFPKAEGTASLVEDLTAEGVHYHCLEIAETIRGGRLLAIRKYLPHFIRTTLLLLRLKPDIVQIVLPNPAHCLGSILACGFLRIPTIIRFGLIYCKWPYTLKKLKLYAWARARNQHLLAISENNRQLICESFGISEQEVFRIYNGFKVIPLSDNTPEVRKTLHLQICQELGLPPTSRLALTVGRLENQKGHIDLIPAIPHITKEFPEVRFVWIGEGKQRDNLLSNLRESEAEDRVLFLGYRSDVPRFLQAAELFVFPTHYEGGQSWAIAEAMAYGLPIVTSDASGIPEVIENKVHGLLFKTGDSCELLDKLRWALEHPEQMQKMAVNARIRAQEFSEERMVRETIELWEKMASNY